jgi:hypothetical protein
MGLPIELPVEPLQGLAVRKMSLSDASRDGAFTARAGLRPQQQIEKVKMREALASPRRPPCLMSSPRTPLAALWC